MKRIFFLYLVISLSLFGCSSGSDKNNDGGIKYARDWFVEYGRSAYLKPEFFFDKDNFHDVDFENITIESPLTSNREEFQYDKFTNMIVSTGKEYLDVGTYDVTLNYQDKAFKKLKIIVKDTIAPVFTDISKTIIREQNSEKFALKNYFKISDISDCSLKFDMSGEDINKPGKHRIKAIATDTWGNKTVEDVVIITATRDEIDNGKYCPTTDLTGNIPQAHRHSWAINYAYEKIPEKYEEKTIIDSPAYDEEIDVFTDVTIYYCNGCLKDITGHEKEHFTMQAINGHPECASFGISTKSVKTGTQKIHHEEVSHKEKKLVSEAKTKKIQNGIVCTECGETRD